MRPFYIYLVSILAGRQASGWLREAFIKKNHFLIDIRQ